MIITQETLQNLSKGSQEAFHSIFETYYSKVFLYTRGFLKNKDDAEDVVQTIFIRLWTHRTSLSNVANFDHYLFTMTHHTMLNFIASKYNMRSYLQTDTLNVLDNHSPQEDLIAKDAQLLVDMVVSQMPSQRQKVYRMSREKGLSNQEIAKILGISKKTVENHLNLALGIIRKAIIMSY